ncbi:UNKNOWN [Stylonychia lemnae]|uniref:Uncharacterized protein n=1 Tax=Stylonychia lemnae TaxID=5949 RepID=A0A078AIV7_STYLE|nr:UNKNOWN [Stylonychia lemnae]|eukprot:CDW82245.1 UNKNOWN [Stylonychia lemnae]
MGVLMLQSGKSDEYSAESWKVLGILKVDLVRQQLQNAHRFPFSVLCAATSSRISEIRFFQNVLFWIELVFSFFVRFCFSRCKTYLKKASTWY